MVTEMDRASERLLVDGILGARPDDGVLGEEGTDQAGTSGVRWILDPLDGTTNYLYGHAGFAVSIGVQIDGVSVAGVVHDPLHGEVFTATLGGGAQRNGRPISVSEESQLGNALVATGFSYEPSRRLLQAQVLAQVIPHVRDIRRMGAAAVDLCSVACGRVDAYYERGLHPWDHAAGALIAREAGALVGHLHGGPEDLGLHPRRPDGAVDARCRRSSPTPAPPTPGRPPTTRAGVGHVHRARCLVRGTITHVADGGGRRIRGHP